MQTYISPTTKLPEITIKVIIIGIILALLLAASNTYLALKIGILTSASIPAAVLSMGILRFFRQANILENNLIQTAASAGEAVAGGIVYTIPALIILHYWNYFPYWENVAIALTGGILGVLFSVPIRRVLVTEPSLPFPEACAITEVLKAGDKKGLGFREILWGGAIGATLEFAQTGLQVVTNSFQFWMSTGRNLVGFGAGFSATLVGAGYLIGFGVGFSLLVGAIIGWLLGVPVLTGLQHVTVQDHNATQTVMNYWSGHMRYMGIGAMLTAGVWTLLTLLKSFYKSLRLSFRAFTQKSQLQQTRTEYDLPINYVALAIGLVLISLFFLFQHIFLLDVMGLAAFLHAPFIIASVLYVFIIGFVFAAICGYFSGLVGVTASPGSAVIIGGLFFAALLIRLLLNFNQVDLSQQHLLTAAAITIIIGAVITGAACIANDNIQDLKVGYLLGATPWKQQVMLMLGVGVAALVIPPIMQLLFNVYGIADVLPHTGMDPAQTLAAPPAAMMAAVTQAVFHHELPWDMVGAGMVITFLAIIVNQILNRFYHYKLSILGIAMGIYLPLSSTIPLFFGSLIALITQRSVQRRVADSLKAQQQQQRGNITACGMVAGAALMGVVLAMPFAITQNPDVLKILPMNLEWLATSLGWLSLPMLGWWLYRQVLK